MQNLNVSSHQWSGRPAVMFQTDLRNVVFCGGERTWVPTNQVAVFLLFVYQQDHLKKLGLKLMIAFVFDNPANNG